MSINESLITEKPAAHVSSVCPGYLKQSQICRCIEFFLIVYEKGQRIPSVKKYAVLGYNGMMCLHIFVAPEYITAFPRFLSSWFAVCIVSLRANLT